MSTSLVSRGRSNANRAVLSFKADVDGSYPPVGNGEFILSRNSAMQNHVFTEGACTKILTARKKRHIVAKGNGQRVKQIEDLPLDEAISIMRANRQRLAAEGFPFVSEADMRSI